MSKEKIQQNIVRSNALGNFYYGAAGQTNNPVVQAKFKKQAVKHYTKAIDRQNQLAHVENAIWGTYHNPMNPHGTDYDILNATKQAARKVDFINSKRGHSGATPTTTVGLVHSFPGIEVHTNIKSGKVAKGPKQPKADPNSKKSKRKQRYHEQMQRDYEYDKYFLDMDHPDE